jgi:hypothetical protein
MTLDVARAVGGAIALGKLRMHERAAERFFKWAIGKKQWASMDAAMKKRALAHAKTVCAELDAGTGEELTTAILHRVKIPVSVVARDAIRRRTRTRFRACLGRSAPGGSAGPTDTRG